MPPAPLSPARAAGVTTVHFDPDGRFAWPELTDIATRGLVGVRRPLLLPAERVVLESAIRGW